MLHRVIAFLLMTLTTNKVFSYRFRPILGIDGAKKKPGITPGLTISCLARLTDLPQRMTVISELQDSLLRKECTRECWSVGHAV